MSDTIVVRGAREHNLQQRRPRAAARPADRVHRPVGLGQVVARVRHDLRRGPAPLRRVAVGVRPAVPRPDGQARRRLHRGPVAGDLDRPEVGVAQPALDRRHDHRDLRLPAPALRPHRRAALPELRPGRSPARRRSRSSTACCELPEGTRFQVLAPVVRGRKGEYDAPARRARGPGLHPGPGRRRDRRARRRKLRARPATRSTRSRSSSTGSCAGRASSAGSPTRSRPRCAWPRAWPRSRSCREGRDAPSPRSLTFSEHLACTHCGAVVRRAGAAQLLVQLAVRRVRARATGSAHASRSTPSWSSPTTTSRSTRARSRRGRASGASTSSGCSIAVGERVRLLHGDAVEEAEGRGQEGRALRHRRQAGARSATRTATGASARTPRSTRASIPWLERRHTEAERDRVREQIEGYMREVPCPACGGARLRPASLAVTIGGQNISRGRRPVDPRRRRRSSTTLELSASATA